MFSPRSVSIVTYMLQVLKLLVTEGAMRAAHQAKQEGSDTVTVEHLEKVLSQLVSARCKLCGSTLRS